MIPYIVRGVPARLARDGWWLSDLSKAGSAGGGYTAASGGRSVGGRSVEPMKDEAGE